MAELGWITFSVSLVLVFTSTAATATTKYFSAGNEGTLSCEIVRDDQSGCESAAWRFVGSGNTLTLTERGRLHEDARTKADRLSVTENCSLVIKKVSAEDAGNYVCTAGQQRRQFSQVYLSVINMTKHTDANKTTLLCSVSSPKRCDHSLKWRFGGEYVNEEGMKTSTSECSATVTFPSSRLKQKSHYEESFECEVTDIYSNKVQLFPFSRQSPGDKPGRRWVFVVALSSLTFVLLAGGVAFFIWRKTKGNKTQVDANTADPEDGVPYAFISYAKKTSCNGQGGGGGDDDDEDDTVTYSIVKASSPSAARSLR